MKWDPGLPLNRTSVQNVIARRSIYVNGTPRRLVDSDSLNYKGKKVTIKIFYQFHKNVWGGSEGNYEQKVLIVILSQRYR